MAKSFCHVLIIFQEFYKKFLVMRNLPVPVIAAINGPAVSFHLNSQSLPSPFENSKRKTFKLALAYSAFLGCSGWCWSLPCSGRRWHQGCLLNSQVAGSTSTLFCYVLWALISNSSYDHWSCIGWVWLSQSLVCILEWQPPIFFQLSWVRRWPKSKVWPPKSETHDTSFL